MLSSLSQNGSTVESLDVIGVVIKKETQETPDGPRHELHAACKTGREGKCRFENDTFGLVQLLI